MPFPNEHAARQLDPADFDKFRRGKMEGAPVAISAIFGIKPDGSSALQSVRAAADKMSVGAFREWLKSHDLKDAIEEATGVETMGDDDADETEAEERKREKEEAARAKAEAAAKRASRGTGGGAGGGSRRYYADPMWGAPYALTLAEGAQSWVEIVRSGRFFGSTGPSPREVTLSDNDIHSMAATYEKVLSERWFAGGAPVGYNHASAMGELTPEATRAAARIQQVEVRANDHGGVSLWGLFSWTDEGASRVGSGDFSAISAEIVHPSSATSKLTGEPMGGWTLVGATLTNAPFIPGMQPPLVSGTVSASEQLNGRIFLSEAEPEPQEHPPMSTENLLLKLAEATGLPSDHSALIGEIHALQDRATKVEVLTETLEIATKEVETLRTRNVVLEDREKTRTLDEACSLGRIAPTEREDYWKIQDTLGQAKAHLIFAEGRIPVDRVTPDQPQAAQSHGIDTAVQALAERLSTEQGLNDAAAYSRAMSEVLSDPEKLAIYESETLN